MRSSSRRTGAVLFAMFGTLACGAAGSGAEGAAGNGASSAGAAGATASSSGGESASGGASNTTGGTHTGGSGTAGATASGGSGGASSGGTSTGGTPGSGGSHTVGSCATLGPAGTLDIVNPPQVTPAADALATFVATNPQVAGTVYTSVGTWAGNRGFYRSTDCGSNWTKVSTGRNAAAINSGFQWSMAVDPTDGNVIYAANGYGSPASLFKSTNGGVDWDSLWPQGSDVVKATGTDFAQGLSMDPTDPKHLVVTLHANCTGAYAPMCMTETTDGGTTWRVFKGPTDGWQEGAGPIVISGAKFLYSASFAGVYYTSDGGAHWAKVADSGGEQLYHSATGTYFLGSGHGVMQSPDGHSWTTISNSPPTDGLLGTGQFIYATSTANTNSEPFYKAPESAPTTWTKVPSATYKQGGSHIAYDPDHHVIYSSNYQGGLARLVVQ